MTTSNPYPREDFVKSLYPSLRPHADIVDYVRPPYKAEEMKTFIEGVFHNITTTHVHIGTLRFLRYFRHFLDEATSCAQPEESLIM